MASTAILAVGCVLAVGIGETPTQLNKIRLDIKELTERADVSLKFLSDIFYARVDRLASTRIGVPDSGTSSRISYELPPTSMNSC